MLRQRLHWRSSSHVNALKRVATRTSAESFSLLRSVSTSSGRIASPTTTAAGNLSNPTNAPPCFLGLLHGVGGGGVRNKCNISNNNNNNKRHLSTAASLDSTAESAATTASTSQTNKNWRLPVGKNTGIKVFNSLTNSLCPLILQRSDNVLTWYSCGPTVYDHSHLGHARNYVSFDIIHRILSDYFHIPVYMLVNVTDVDDKIIKRSKEKGVHPLSLAREFEKSFLDDMKALGVREPSYMVRVSEHIPEIIKFVDDIIKRGFAYVADGGVWFDTRAYEAANGVIGKLKPSDQHTSYDQQYENAENKFLQTKRDPRDFALWKLLAKDEPAEDGIGAISWDSPWGRGRPGWHIECSAMIHSVFGGQLDLHSGGIDLKFPHHNNEIIQSEAHEHPGHHHHDHHHHDCAQHNQNHNQWCNYFIHTGHLHISGLKMSKSLKNFITIKEYLYGSVEAAAAAASTTTTTTTTSKQPAAGGIGTAQHFRLFCLMHPYNSAIEYSPDRISEAIQLEKKFIDFFKHVGAIRKLQDQKALEIQRRMQAEQQQQQQQQSNISAGTAAGAEREVNPMVLDRKWGTARKQFYERFLQRKNAIHSSLANNFDTPSVVHHLLETITDTYSNFPLFIFEQQHVPPVYVSQVLDDVASYIAKTMALFGVDFGSYYNYNHHYRTEEGQVVAGQQTAASPGSHQQVIGFEACLDRLVDFRGEIRQICRDAIIKAKAQKQQQQQQPSSEGAGVQSTALPDFEAVVKQVLQICDSVREMDFNTTGATTGAVVKIDDISDSKSVWRIVSKTELEMEEKKKQYAGGNKDLQKQKQAELEARAKLSPEEYFKSLNVYSAFDENGVPTHDLNGAELSKNARKKLLKEADKQRQLHESYINNKDNTNKQQSNQQ